jgi:mRNA interferase RelE/StbE
MYRVELRLRPQKSMEKIPAPNRVELINVLSELENDPRPKGVEKVRGTELWRIRAGNYRIIYAIDDKEQVVTIV